MDPLTPAPPVPFVFKIPQKLAAVTPRAAVTLVLRRSEGEMLEGISKWVG